jgi:hypothetical protein
MFNTQLSYKPHANLVSSLKEPDLLQGVHFTPPDTPDQLIAAAIAVSQLYTVDRLTKYAIGVRLNSKSAAHLLVGRRKVLEPAVNAIAAEVWSEDYLKLIMVPPESHGRLVERAIRPLKEHVLDCCERYGCSALPRIVGKESFSSILLFSDLVSGERLDLSKWRQFAFMPRSMISSACPTTWRR